MCCLDVFEPHGGPQVLSGSSPALATQWERLPKLVAPGSQTSCAPPGPQQANHILLWEPEVTSPSCYYEAPPTAPAASLCSPVQSLCGSVWHVVSPSPKLYVCGSNKLLSISSVLSSVTYSALSRTLGQGSLSPRNEVKRR